MPRLSGPYKHADVYQMHAAGDELAVRGKGGYVVRSAELSRLLRCKEAG